MTVLVAIDGVLRSDDGTPVDDAIAIARALLEHERVVFVSADQDKDARFLAREGLYRYAGLQDAPFLDALMRERSMGHVGAVLTPSTDEAREAARQGVTVLLVSASTHINPAWRPTRAGWGEIAQEADA